MKNCTYVVRTVLLLCALSLFTGPINAQVPAPFSQQGIKSSKGDFLGFLQYKPADYDKQTSTKYPLIIFLHGIGERGNGTSQLANVTCCGLPRIIKLGHKMNFTWNGKTETFLVIAPQCPVKYGMWPPEFIDDLIKYAKQNLRVDPDRIFLTGLSMGGGGTLKYISSTSEYPKNLAAAATICAPCTFSNGKYVADAKLPVWSFHAEDDPTASVTCTKMAITKILGANPEVKPLLNLWPTGGHVVWDRVYTDTNHVFQGVVNIYEWFLGQNRKLAVNKLPVAKASGNQEITTGTGTTTLSASSSTDADGKIVRYVWKKIGGPSAGVITNAFGTSSSTTVTGLTVAGTYTYALFVVDDRAAFTSDTIKVNVTAGATIANKAPLAKAGADITITLPVNTVKLSGTGSTDEDGSLASYVWSKVSGPAVSISTPNSSATDLNSLVEGTYVIKLKVTDNKGGVSEDQVTVKVNAAPLPANKLPVAKAGNDITITLPVNKVNLSGTGSTDEDGSLASYIWSKVSGPDVSISTPNSSATDLNNLAEGTYVIKLKVTDNKGGVSEDQVTVKVNAAPLPANKLPVAKAGNDITITLPVNTVNLSGTGSTDEDGSLASYVWSKVSGPAVSISTPNSSATDLNSLVEGTYVIKLKVTDNKGGISEDQVTVKVNAAPLPANKIPVARAGNDITITLPVNKATLNGNGSTDADGTINSYSWTKLTGPNQYIFANSNAGNTEVTNLAEGIYVFRLRVTDNKGAVGSDTIVVKVNQAPPPVNIHPIAQAGANKTITLPVNTVTLDGDQSSDEDGSIASYTWSYVSGPDAYTITNAGDAITDITGLTEGTYSFRLLVKDNKGETDADTITVKVNQTLAPPPPPNSVPVAKAGNDRTITLPDNSVILNGSASTDADGTIDSYRWNKIKGPASINIVSSYSSITEINNLSEGTYYFWLMVKDNDGAISRDTIKVVVNPALNIIPNADAGEDIEVKLPNPTIRLNGRGSNDPDGTIATYDWTKVSGSSGITITNSTTPTPGIVGVKEGVYVFRLIVKDDKGGEGSDIVKVTVLPADETTPPAANQSPVADAGADLTIALPETTAELHGDLSHDIDGMISSYSWNLVSGDSAVVINNANSAVANLSNLETGEYVFALTITDNNGDRSVDSVNVSVVNNLRYENQISVYPNPTKSDISIQLSSDTSGAVNVAMYNVSGLLVKTFTTEKTGIQYQKRLSVADLQPGLYYVEVMIGNKQKMVSKFIKQR